MQYVDKNNSNLSSRRIGYGVLQESRLGQLLFLNFINDIANSTNTIPRLYADDTCSIFNIHSPKRLKHNINNELAKLFLSKKLNKLTLNPSKSHALSISPTIEKATPNLKTYLNSTNLNITESVKYLGVILGNKLFLIVIKVSRRVGIMTKLKYLLPVLQNIYFALIHSYFNYEILVWSATFNSHLISFNTFDNSDTTFSSLTLGGCLSRRPKSHFAAFLVLSYFCLYLFNLFGKNKICVTDWLTD